MFPENLNVSLGGTEGNIEIQGKKLTVSKGPVLKKFFIFLEILKLEIH